MKIDVMLSVEGNHLRGMAATAPTVESLGFDGLWTNETRHDPFLPLAVASEHSRNLQLGTAVAIAFARSPMVVAQSAWDLQGVSGGRLMLGLGTQVKGHIQRRFSMPFDSPAARLRDYILALRAIWRSFQTGEKLDYRGRFYSHTLMTPFFNPGPIDHPHIPVYVAGVNTRLAEVAGEVGDGFLVHPMHSPKYLREVVVPAIGKGMNKAGRSRRDFEISSSTFVITGSDGKEIAEQREKIRAQVAFYASTPSYRITLQTHGWEQVGERLSRLAAVGKWNEMGALITDEMLREFAVEARTDEIGQALLARYEGVLDRVSLYMPFEPGRNTEFWQGLVDSLA